MARCFYTLFSVFFLLSCSGESPVRHLLTGKVRAGDVALMSADAENARTLFPLHYSLKVDSTDISYVKLSYSFVAASGDSLFWEEGVIRMP